MLKKLYNHLFCQPHMGRRIPVLLLSVIVMGVCVEVFTRLDVGTDPCTVFNAAFSQNVLGWKGIGTWQLLLNVILLIGLFFLKELKRIGLGSVANMVLVGYSKDAAEWLFDRLGVLTPGSFGLGTLIPCFIGVTAVFLVAVAFYMVVELGTAPYDAVPQVISARLPKVPFALIRICFDIFVTAMGLICRGTMGVFTVAACFFLGPVISWIAAKFRPWFN